MIDRLAERLREWSSNCLIDGLHMDRGEPTLQELLHEAATRLADETIVPLNKLDQAKAEATACSAHEIERLRSMLDVAQKAALEAEAYALKTGRVLEMWLARTPNPPEWHWSHELHARTREVLFSGDPDV